MFASFNICLVDLWKDVFDILIWREKKYKNKYNRIRRKESLKRCNLREISFPLKENYAIVLLEWPQEWQGYLCTLKIVRINSKETKNTYDSTYYINIHYCTS